MPVNVTVSPSDGGTAGTHPFIGFSRRISDWGFWLGEWKEILVKSGPAAAGYLARPENGAKGGVLLCAAYWGVTSHFRRLCDDLAAAGFTALAPNLYEQRTTTDDPREAENLLTALEDDRVDAVLVAATNLLLDQPGTGDDGLGGIGFSFGGWAIAHLSTMRPELRAVASCYGFAESADYARHRADAYQLHLAAFDDFPEELEMRYIAAVEAAGASIDVFRYDDARHGFMNDEHPEDFHPDAASLAWHRIRQFMMEQLQEPPPSGEKA